MVRQHKVIEEDPQAVVDSRENIGDGAAMRAREGTERRSRGKLEALCSFKPAALELAEERLVASQLQACLSDGTERLCARPTLSSQLGPA